jgi:transposase-like protein
VNSQGQDELYDEDTGEIVAVGKKRERDRNGSRLGRSHAKGAQHHWVKVRNADGNVCIVPAGTDPTTLPAKKPAFTYSELTKDLIIQEVLKGHSLMKISRMEGMPTQDVIYTWRSKYPDFERAVREAKKLRAEYHADLVLDIAENTTKETNVEDRLKVEVYKWAASVEDPDQFGTRIKHAGDAQNPVQWVIQTGVPQSEEKPIEVESTPAKEPDVHE